MNLLHFRVYFSGILYFICCYGPTLHEICEILSTEIKVGIFDSQSESFIIFGSPAVVLGLGGILPLLVTEEGADDVDFNEGPEDS